MAFAFAALALVFLGAEAATSADGDETLRRLLRAAQDFDPRAAIDGVAAEVERLGPLGAAYFAAVYVVAEVLALPAVPLTASAGYLFGAVEGTAIVLFSATIAAGVSFLIGRSLLRSWVERVAGESAQFQAIDRAVASEGFKIILLLRLSPIFPFALSNYFYGLTAVEFGPYLAATLLGFAPGTSYTATLNVCIVPFPQIASPRKSFFALSVPCDVRACARLLLHGHDLEGD